MATDLIMPTLPGDQPQSHHMFPERPHHARAHSYHIQPGPQISPLSTSELTNSQTAASTPSSPRSSIYGRPVRPLYIPAVLRPNEFPVRRKANKCNGTDSGVATPDSGSESDYTLHQRSSGSFVGVGGLAMLGQHLSRRSTGENSKCLGGDWDLDLFPAVTALPTREHWKPDCESSICDDPTCKRNFSYFTRRHHCRKCGNIFCDWHSSYIVPLDQDANFNPRASPSRTCNHCFEMFKSWYSRNNSQGSSSDSSDLPHTTPSTPIAARRDNNITCLAKTPDAAASVPRDWNWSTF